MYLGIYDTINIKSAKAAKLIGASRLLAFSILSIMIMWYFRSFDILSLICHLCTRLYKGNVSVIERI